MRDTIVELLRSLLLVVGALFPIVNSPENIPIFLDVTSGFPAESREILARKIAVNGFALLVVSVMIGTHILAFFGISLPVVLIGGGLILVAAVHPLKWRECAATIDSGPSSPPAPSR